MASGINSYVGFSKQADQSTIGTKDERVTTDNLFNYLPFLRGTGMAPVEVTNPIPQEIGSGAMTRDADKLAVNAAGTWDFIPRAKTIGHILLGLMGDVSTVTGDPVSGAHTHTFKFDSDDEFNLPWWTFRRKTPLWGEDFTDCRFVSMTLNMPAAGRVGGTVGVLGITPAYVDDTSLWVPKTYLDKKPAFLTCTGVAELPDGTSMQARNISLTVMNVVNINQQRIVGQYVPDGLDVISRMVTITFTAKVPSAALYKKMAYTTGADEDWDATLYKEADLDLIMKSTEFITGTTPYSLRINANGKDEASGEANIIWTVQPVAPTPDDSLIMNWTGFWTEDPSAAPVADGPLSFALINDVTSYK